MNMKIRILFMLLLIGMAAFIVFGLDDKMRTPLDVKAEEGAKSEPLKFKLY